MGMSNETVDFTKLERRAREVFDVSVDGLGAHERSRLNQARQAATAELERSRAPLWRTWAPAAALAGAALVAVVLWRAPDVGGPAPQQAQAVAQPVEPVELVAAGDDLDLVTEDLGFYEFVAQETGSPGNGNG
jgi:hypothetical protein